MDGAVLTSRVFTSLSSTVRMSFDGFIQALNEIAVRKLGDTMSEPEAFKEIVTKVPVSLV